MSHEEQGPTLARWLDQPAGTTPPEDLDREVVEAMYALRPDLAPRPRLTADDILASVTTGPLAGAGAATPPPAADAGGEVVPFPARRPVVEEAAAPAPRRSGWPAWARGTGGIGLALVAAATFLLVAVPTLREQEPPSDAGVAIVASPAASAPAEQAQAPLDPPAAPSPPPPPARTEVAASRTAVPDGAYDMKPMAPLRGRETIPEVAAELATREAEQDAVAVADEPAVEESAGSAGAVAAPAAPAEPMVDLDAVRKRVLPKDVKPTGWRDGVDGDTLARIDRAIEQANGARARGDLRTAADTLAAVVGPPPRAGMYVAHLAAQDYLRAGMAGAAAGVAQRGLGLSSENLPERSLLLVLYGDAMRAQEAARPALDAYEQAEDANLNR